MRSVDRERAQGTQSLGSGSWTQGLGLEAPEEGVDKTPETGFKTGQGSDLEIHRLRSQGLEARPGDWVRVLESNLRSQRLSGMGCWPHKRVLVCVHRIRSMCSWVWVGEKTICWIFLDPKESGWRS